MQVHRLVRGLLALWQTEERNVWKPRLISNPEDQKKLARALCRNFYDNPEWHQARLTSISQSPDGILHVHITEPSTD